MKNASWGSALVNGVGLISNLMALYAANFVYENPYATGFGGHFQYLTILGLTTATLACAVKLVRFFVPGAMEVCYEVLTNIATPMEGLISLLYWSMVFLEPTLLIPEDMPPIPVVVDCALHLYPALFLWIDFLVFNINFKRSPRHVAVIYGFAMFYLAWSWLCQTQNGHWPYPFLDKLTPVPRAGFYLFCGTLCWIIYEAGAVIHAKLHQSSSTAAYYRKMKAKKL
ncbi:hypothetical protein O0I10_010719 [Lichtheimia ornata]|uniref:FAR-17a/AIG1-like protein n=1 Tax=Lichtheimia ornata TaxID=688661 RepID=A0AAD7XXF5_9FUNG|nr:uncharacterized protein O0I10_010719 [Lichtheimia ornata]KAJ8653572.1 hypothetical protein O0I10_010719 [Lichtheimia ornata]